MIPKRFRIVYQIISIKLEEVTGITEAIRILSLVRMPQWVQWGVGFIKPQLT